MTWIDAIMVGVVVVSAGISFARGFVREVLGVGAWVGALLAGFLAQPYLGPAIANYVEPRLVADGIVVATVFVIVLVVLKLIIAWIGNKVRGSTLGGVDRVFGVGFGLVRGGFLLASAYVVVGLFVPAVERWPVPLREARTLPLVADAAEWVVKLLPVQYRPRVPEAPAGHSPLFEQLLRPAARQRSAT